MLVAFVMGPGWSGVGARAGAVARGEPVGVDDAFEGMGDDEAEGVRGEDTAGLGKSAEGALAMAAAEAEAEVKFSASFLDVRVDDEEGCESDEAERE